MITSFELVAAKVRALGGEYPDKTALGVYTDLSSVPLPDLMAAGATIALGADDPLLFGSRLAGQYATMRAAHDLTDAQLADLERTLNLANEGNAELTFGWLQIALAHRYQPAVATAEKFLTSQGRRKFVLPLFQTLWNEGDWGRPIARRIYAEARPLYHPVTSGSVDQLVGRQ